ncbi:MAG: hypothetical protein Q8L29_02415 [archaeon]|nr:hypothetical protein [archaeon]
MRNESIKNLEEEIKEEQRTRNLFKLRNRMLRYQKRLVKEGMRIAEREGITILQIPENSLVVVNGENADRIYLRLGSDGKSYNPMPIIHLARENCPSLFRKYDEAKIKYFAEICFNKR